MKKYYLIKMKILRAYTQIMSVHIFRSIHAPISYNMRGLNHVHRGGQTGRPDGRRDGQAESNILSPKLRFRGGGGMIDECH